MSGFPRPSGAPPLGRVLGCWHLPTPGPPSGSQVPLGACAGDREGPTGDALGKRSRWVRAAVVCWLRSTGVPLVPLWRSPLSDPEDSGTSLGPHGRRGGGLTHSLSNLHATAPRCSGGV